MQTIVPRVGISDGPTSITLSRTGRVPATVMVVRGKSTYAPMTGGQGDNRDLLISLSLRDLIEARHQAKKTEQDCVELTRALVHRVVRRAADDGILGIGNGGGDTA